MGTPKKPGAGVGKKNSQWEGGSKSTDGRHARTAWARCHGGKRAPKGYIVHHKDGNPENNACSNLELISLAEHNEGHKEGKSWDQWATQAKNKPNTVKQRRYR
jgi:hypothetical protein